MQMIGIGREEKFNFKSNAKFDNIVHIALYIDCFKS